MERVRGAASKESRRSWDESRPRLWRDQLKSKPSSSRLAAARAVAQECRRSRRGGSNLQPVPVTVPLTNSRPECAVRYKSPLLRNSSPCRERKFRTLDYCRRARPPSQGAPLQPPWRERQRQLQRGFQQLSYCRQGYLRASNLKEAI